MACIQETSRRNNNNHNHKPSHGTPQGSYRQRGTPLKTWQRDTEKETKEMGYASREMAEMVTNRQLRCSLVDVLCS